MRSLFAASDGWQLLLPGLGGAGSFAVRGDKAWHIRVGEPCVRLASAHAVMSHRLVVFVKRVAVFVNMRLLDLAVYLIVAGGLVRVDHRKHLAEALTHPRDALARVSEWELVPWHELNLLSHHVHQIFLARRAGKPTKRLLAKHSILLVFAVTLSHHQAVEVLDLLLMEL